MIGFKALNRLPTNGYIIGSIGRRGRFEDSQIRDHRQSPIRVRFRFAVAVIRIRRNSQYRINTKFSLCSSVISSDTEVHVPI